MSKLEFKVPRKTIVALKIFEVYKTKFQFLSAQRIQSDTSSLVEYTEALE